MRGRSMRRIYLEERAWTHGRVIIVDPYSRRAILLEIEPGWGFSQNAVLRAPCSWPGRRGHHPSIFPNSPLDLLRRGARYRHIRRGAAARRPALDGARPRDLPGLATKRHDAAGAFISFDASCNAAISKRAVHAANRRSPCHQERFRCALRLSDGP